MRLMAVIMTKMVKNMSKRYLQTLLTASIGFSGSLMLYGVYDSFDDYVEIWSYEVMKSLFAKIAYLDH